MASKTRSTRTTMDLPQRSSPMTEPPPVSLTRPNCGQTGFSAAMGALRRFSSEVFGELRWDVRAGYMLFCFVYGLHFFALVGVVLVCCLSVGSCFFVCCRGVWFAAASVFYHRSFIRRSPPVTNLAGNADLIRELAASRATFRVPSFCLHIARLFLETCVFKVYPTLPDV